MVLNTTSFSEINWYHCTQSFYSLHSQIISLYSASPQWSNKISLYPKNWYPCTHTTSFSQSNLISLHSISPHFLLVNWYHCTQHHLLFNRANWYHNAQHQLLLNIVNLPHCNQHHIIVYGLNLNSTLHLLNINRANWYHTPQLILHRVNWPTMISYHSQKSKHVYPFIHITVIYNISFALSLYSVSSFTILSLWTPLYFIPHSYPHRCSWIKSTQIQTSWSLTQWTLQTNFINLLHLFFQSCSHQRFSAKNNRNFNRTLWKFCTKNQ